MNEKEKKPITFQELIKGAIENPTEQQISDAIQESINVCKNMQDLNAFLTSLHPSDAYKVIRDYVKPSNNKMVKDAKINDTDNYQLFQEVQRESKAVFDYERKTPTCLEVQNIAKTISQQYYGIAVRMVGKLDDELSDIKAAINRIEEHLKIDVTNFEKAVASDDTTESGDEQRIKEDTE